MSCINIIVNIANYDPGMIYTGYVRPKGSIVAFGTYPQYTRVAGSNQIVFKGLPAGDYEVGLKRQCDNENASQVAWQDATDQNCIPPAVAFNSGTSTFTITLPSATVGYEYRLDEGEWQKIDSDGTDTRTLTITTINTALDDYESDRTLALIDFQFRTSCGTGRKSAITHFYRVEDDTEYIPQLSKIKTLCEGGNYKGVVIRCTISFGTPLAETEEKVVYHAVSGDISVDEYTRVDDPLADMQHYYNFFGGYNLIRHVDSTDGSLIAYSFDFISYLPPQGVPGETPCGEYDLDFTILENL